MTILTKILKAPVQLLVIVSYGASWYAAYANMQGITYGVPIIYTLLIGAYALGWYLENRTDGVEPK